MRVINTADEVRAMTAGWRREKKKIALVATMGGLHAGHCALIERAREMADRTTVSLFVNRPQFDKDDDYARYPKTIERDLTMLRAYDVDLAFAPDEEAIYPPSETIRWVEPGALADDLCGAYRPGFFRGVATVVVRLFSICTPDTALFGEKDYQQLMMIRNVVKRRALPVEIVGVPTVREADGLACSSRNVYLTVEQRKRAPELFLALYEVATRIRSGECDFPALERECMRRLRAATFVPDYVAVRRLIDLAPATSPDEDLIVLSAATLGCARLIDNVPIRKH